MAVITPNTDLYLLKVPLEINDINQLDFNDITAQYNYFNSLPKLAVDDFTYQRKDSTIRFPAQYDEIVTYNYVMYRNDAYSDKWFYAYIVNMEYVNDNMTMITIKSDVWQCWQFELTYKPCLIDREHTNNDTVGNNTLPEGLELGEMVCNGSTTNFGGGTIDNVNKKYYTIIEVSQIDNKGSDGSISYSWVSGSHELTPCINEIERGTIPLIVGGTFAGHSSGQIRSASDITYLFDNSGLGGSIINIYMLPQELVPAYNEVEITSTPTVGNQVTMDGIGVPVGSSSVTTIGTYSFTKPTTVNGYTPKNKKLLTWPFCYFNISNNAGGCVPYRYEDFTSVQFKVEGTFGVSGSTKATPQNYLNISGNALDYSVNGAKFPVCSWGSDSYTNWLTQNAANMQMQWKSAILGSLGQVGSAAIQGAIGGASAGALLAGVGAVPGAILGAGAAAIGSAVSIPSNLVHLAREQHMAKTEANMTPDQARGNMGAGDFLWAKYRSPFTYMPMSIKTEYAVICDQYFSQFGYKTDQVKIPNIRGRRNWNYVKTIGCYIDADIPQEDLAQIKAMFDNGITIWHNPANFANYNANNDII